MTPGWLHHSQSDTKFISKNNFRQVDYWFVLKILHLFMHQLLNYMALKAMGIGLSASKF